MSTTPLQRDLEASQDQPLSSSPSPSSHTFSRVLHPLQNLSLHQPSSSTRSSAPPKSSRPVYYAPYPPHQQLRLDACTPGSSSSRGTATSMTHVGAADVQASSRAAFVGQYDYVEMKLHGSRDQRDELAKKPFPGEPGVIYHSPTHPNVTYDTIFQTTHDFIDLNETIRHYPTFVELPLQLRPSKVRYDATKNNDDLMLRVRCLFCRGRFGGKNAKAIWERHVKEHWPKPDRVRESYKEEGRRPVRHLHKRSSGSSSHGRNRSSDGAWVPTGRNVEHSDTETYTSYSSRASSLAPSANVPASDASPVYFPHVQHDAVRVHDDADTEDNAAPKNVTTSSSLSQARRVVRSPSPDSSEEETEQATKDNIIPFTVTLGYWNIVFERESWSRASRTCPSKSDIISSLDAAAANLVLDSEKAVPTTVLTLNNVVASIHKATPTPAPTEMMTEDAGTPRKRHARKRSHSQSEDSDSSDELEQTFVSPGHKRRRVVGHSSSSSEDSNSGSSGYHSNSDRESM